MGWVGTKVPCAVGTVEVKLGLEGGGGWEGSSFCTKSNGKSIIKEVHTFYCRGTGLVGMWNQFHQQYPKLRS